MTFLKILVFVFGVWAFIATLTAGYVVGESNRLKNEIEYWRGKLVGGGKS